MESKTGLRPGQLGSKFESIEPETLDRLIGRALPPSLNTGIGFLDFEHAQLLSCMSTLRQICGDMTRNSCNLCDGVQREKCESSLIGLLGDLLIFILDHFHQEERAMHDSLLYMLDRDVCEAHMEDHAQISEKIQKIVAANDPVRMVIQLRELGCVLEKWVSHHVLLHDQALENWMARQDLFMGLTRKA